MAEAIKILRSSADDIESNVSLLSDAVSLDVSEREELSFGLVNFYCNEIKAQISQTIPIFPELKKDERYIELLEDGLKKYKRRFPFLGRWKYDTKIVEDVIIPNASEIGTILRLYAEAEDRHYSFLSVSTENRLSKLKLIKKPTERLEEKLSELKDVVFNEDVRARVDNVLKPMKELLRTYGMLEEYDEVDAWLEFFDNKYRPTEKLDSRFYRILKEFHHRLNSDIESYKAI